MLDTAAHMGQCSVCFYAFCSACRLAYHPGAGCAASDALRTERLSRLAESQTVGQVAERRRREAALELMNLRLIKKTSMVGPGLVTHPPFVSLCW